MNYQRILLIAATIVFGHQFPLKAQESTNPATNTFGNAFDPPNSDRPLATKGGAARGEECLAGMQNSPVPLTPILPAIEQRLTLASHPTFFINLPPTSAKQVFFKIRDRNEDYEYTTILPITGKGGVTSVTLPPDAPALETGQTYQWFLAVMCQEQLKPDSPMVQGSVKRVTTIISSSEPIKAITQLEKAEMYAQGEIWYETISILAQLREEQPEDSNLFTIWEKLLTSVGLEGLAQAEFVD